MGLTKTAFRALPRIRLQDRTLSSIAGGASLAEVLDMLCLFIEDLIEDTHCAVLLREANGDAFRVAAGPSLPSEILAGLGSISLEDHLGLLNGRAAGGTEPLVGDDADTQPTVNPTASAARMSAAQGDSLQVEPAGIPGAIGLSDLAGLFGVASCYCTLILSESGETLGLFAITGDEPGPPDTDQLRCLETASYLAGIAVRRDQAREALFEERDFNSAILETTSALVIVLDANGHIIRLNAAAAACTGYKEESVVGRGLGDLLSAEEFATPEWDPNCADGPVGFWINQGEHLIRTQAGARRRILGGGRVILGSSGEVKFIVCTGVDVTDIRSTEEEKRRLEKELIHSQKMEAVGTLASGIAHDFNNFITAIFGFTDLAGREMAEDHPARTYLDEIAKAAQMGADMTRSLLTFSRKTESYREDTDLCALVRDGVRLLGRLMPSSIQMELAIPEGEAWISADSTQIQQILVSLAVNGRDAMPQGGKLLVRVELDSVEHRLIVEDTGVGMDAEVRARIFEPFFTTKARGRGTGLGLSVLHGIVSNHGGSVEVQSRPGVGTRFLVRLPALAEVASAAQGPAADDEITQPALPTKRILVAACDDFIRAIITSGLRSENYGILIATAADEMRQALGAAEPPALVILDESMTCEACDIAAQAGAERQPLLRIVSADNLGPGPRPQRGVLTKPFRMLDLLQAVDDLVSTAPAETKANL
ncbi:MAG: ATP-binding protein [Planctomycetota bacterium]|jgi:PAS domain S-box-containing protein|nr:ATP-binding protein [Planctomycetota bacterium]MDP6956563.1 ATP-binding protein [Planctomycetota bacterium]